MDVWQVALAAGIVGAIAGVGLERLAAWSLTIGDQGDDTPLPRRTAWMSAAAGLSCAGVTIFAGLVPTLPAWWAFALGSVTVSRTDLARHRIPDVLALGMLVIGAGLLFLASTQDNASDAYLRAWIAAAASFGVFLLLGLFARAGLGMGDVKLAPTLGLYLGYYGWADVVLGLFAGFILGALTGLVIVVIVMMRRGRARDALRRSIPFGPFLCLGALLPIVLG
ncbi:MAG: prepilin peptidase [Actinomycetota bacterium]